MNGQTALALQRLVVASARELCESRQHARTNEGLCYGCLRETMALFGMVKP